MTRRFFCAIAVLLSLLVQRIGAQVPQPSQSPQLEPVPQAEQIPAPVQPPKEAPTPGVPIPRPEMDAVLTGQAPNPNQTPSVFFDAEYLLWWVSSTPGPVLLTTAPNNGNNGGALNGGTLGVAGTTPVFGANNINYGALSGMRLGVGANFGDDNFFGVEASGFFLPKTSFNYTASGNASGAPFLTIPFQDAATGQQASLDVVSQDSSGKPYLTGSVTVHSDIEVWGYEFNGVAHSIRTANRRFDLLFGFRALGLNENFSMDQNVTALQNGALSIQTPTANGTPANYVSLPAGSSVNVYDSFATQNRFYGAQIGGRFGWDFGPLSADLTGKIAFGVTHEMAAIYGVSSSSTGIVTQGGTFALSSNIGDYGQNQFAVVPEIGLKLNYALASWVNVHIGYNALYWSDVARPTAQIDTVLNSKLIPTGASLINAPFNPNSEQGRPFFSFQSTSFWTQGVSAGIEFRY